MFRTETGHYNEIDNDAAGGALQAFGRNCPGYAPSARRVLTPDPFLVAEKLLARRESGSNRDYFKPAGAQLNIMAAAWIQAMTVRGRICYTRIVRYFSTFKWEGCACLYGVTSTVRNTEIREDTPLRVDVIEIRVKLSKIGGLFFYFCEKISSDVFLCL